MSSLLALYKFEFCDANINLQFAVTDDENLILIFRIELMKLKNYLLCCTLLYTGCAHIHVENNQRTHRAHDKQAKCSLPIANIVDADQRTQVMVLATPHLRAMGDDFQPQYLDRLLNILQKYNPDRIAVEHLTPEQIHQMLQDRKNFDPILQQFVGKSITISQQARETLKTDWETALTKAQDIVDQHQKNHSEIKPEDRMELIRFFLAGHDDISAALHWKMLPTSQQNPNPWIRSEWVDFLNKKINSNNEISTIGMFLATRLGLNQIDSIDDHWDKKHFMKIAPQLMSDLKDHPSLEKVMNADIYKESKNREKVALANKDLLPYYLYLNSDTYLNEDIDTQWGIFLRTNLESGLDRVRYSLWEIRNLRIVTHIREVIAKNPVHRMLVIIGASHKPFLDTYLSQLADVDVVHLESIANS